MRDYTKFIDTRIAPSTVSGAMPPLLTVAMANHKNFGEFSMTLTNIAYENRDLVNEFDVLCVDNAPDSGDGSDIKSALAEIPNGYYCALSPYKGTLGVKNTAMLAARSEYVLFIDSHVKLGEGAIRKTLRFLEKSHPTNDLFQGPIIDRLGSTYATHMNPALSSGNFGRWGTYRQDNGHPIGDDKMYEVPAHGMGLFLTRRDTWPGFHPAMHQFGSEEGYIHEKFRLLGRKCWNLPFLKWWHLFRKDSVCLTYPMSGDHKYRNQLISWREVSLDTEILDKYWLGHSMSPQVQEHIKANVDSLDIQPIPRPADMPPFLGYPVRLLGAPHHQSDNFREFEKPIFYE